jgi:uncharacterized protein YndB with AHSA1/START domain
MSDTDRIVKSVVLNAPRERVWRAISESKQFGAWFGMSFDGPFVAGRPITGRIAPTQADPEVAKLQAPHVGKSFEFMVESIEPMDRLALRWHPYAVDPKVDYSQEPMTLVEFVLEDAGAGTKLTITESGFDRIPLARRAEAFKANEGGWEHQTRLIKKYLER